MCLCRFFIFTRVPEHLVKSITWQTLQAVNFCHKHNVSFTIFLEKSKTVLKLYTFLGIILHPNFHKPTWDKRLKKTKLAIPFCPGFIKHVFCK
jgi:hypothetical protein